MLVSSPLSSAVPQVHAAAESGQRLDGPGKAFRASGGAVDVFALALKEGVQTGRLPLFRVEDGGFLFGLGQTDAVCLLAVPAAGARLEAADTGATADVAAAIDAWTGRLMQALDVAPPKQVASLAATGMWALAAGHSARPASGAVWIWAVNGEAAILGAIPVPGAGATPLPVTSRTFVTADAPAVLQAVTTAVLLTSGAHEDALKRLFANLGAHLLDLFAARMTAAREAERTQLAARQAASGTIWRRAQSRLASVLDSDAPIAQASRWDSDAVFQSVSILAGEAGARAVAPAGEGVIPPSIKDRLDAIGRASGFRVREIELNARWREGATVPCLALFAGENAKHPVVILPRGSRGAVMADPATGARSPVDDAAAQKIAGAAYELHWLLPPVPLTAYSLLAFGMRRKMAHFTAILLASAAAALLALAVPVITATIAGRIIPNAELGQLGQLLALLFGTAIASFCFVLVRMLTLLRLQGLIDSGLQCALWDRLLSLPAPFFGRMTAGDLANRALGVNWISTALGGPLLSAVISGLASLLSLTVMAYYSWRLTLAALVLIVIVLGVTALIVRAMIRAQRQHLSALGSLTGTELQLLTAAPKLQVACATGRAFANWAEGFAQVTRASFHSSAPQCRMTIFTQVFQPLATLALLFTIVLVAGSISTPDFVAFNAAFGQFLGMAMGLAAALVDASIAVPLYERAKPILETLPEDLAGKTDPGELQGAITLHGVRFRYEQEGRAVFDGLDLDIRAGEYVAIAGPSGAGKSTLLRLLLGFEQPELGEIAFDGKSLDSLDPHALRRQISVVMQQGRLMPASIFDNIASQGRYSLDQAWEAAEQAGLAGSIRRMPMGMQTWVNEGSSTLSGGERQRLMLARAFIRNARIFMFDEATSALDNETQAIVTGTLAKLSCTRLVIAHRLSTIQNVDRIIVLNHGKAAEQGGFHDLMGKRGEFYALAKRQLV